MSRPSLLRLGWSCTSALFICATAGAQGIALDPGLQGDGPPAIAVPGSIGGQADLSMLKDGTGNLDGTIDYTLTVNNAGPDPATNVIVTDDLPACTIYVSDDCGGADVPPWTWNVGVLPLNSPVTCTITVDATGCGGPGAIFNTAVVTADESDPAPGNNDSTAGVIPLNADLSITKQAVLDPDDTVDYTLTVSNQGGPSFTTNVVVTDELPPCTTYLSDDCGGINLPPWTWNIGALPVNTSVMCTITVDAAGCQGTVSNTAMVTADQTDPFPGDESSTAVLDFGTPMLEIPTLGRWGLLALISLLIGLGVWRLRST
jgi:uncharacterized repeat protein (TIGR01451 family)